MNFTLSLPPQRKHRLAVSAYFSWPVFASPPGLRVSPISTKAPSRYRLPRRCPLFTAHRPVDLPTARRLAGCPIWQPPHRHPRSPALRRNPSHPRPGQYHLAVGSLSFCFGMFGNGLNISINTQAIGTEALYGRTIMLPIMGLGAWPVSPAPPSAICSFPSAGSPGSIF